MDLYIIGDISENAVDLVSKYFSISARPVRKEMYFFIREIMKKRSCGKTRIKTK